MAHTKKLRKRQWLALALWGFLGIMAVQCVLSSPNVEDTAAGAWVASNAIREGVAPDVFFARLPSGEGYVWEWVPTAGADRRRHEARFPDGSTVVSGWNVVGEGGGLALDFYAADP